jgi:triosephosphate isomerase
MAEMGRKPLVAGNWKMHKTGSEARAFCRTLKQMNLPLKQVDVAVFPSFVALESAAAELDGSGVRLGAQNIHPAGAGAFTGEVSANMLLTVGCQYVIIGHSERRQLFGETDAFIREKVDAALKAGLVPVICVGETRHERESGRTETVVRGQVDAAARGLVPKAGNVAFAYEPVWAIGTGAVASPEDAQMVHAAIRGWLVGHWGDPARDVKILYGGSVKPDNARALLSCPDIDGALVGGASLEPESFRGIIEAAV